LSPILHLRFVSISDAPLNNLSTAAELGSVELFFWKASAVRMEPKLFYFATSATSSSLTQFFILTEITTLDFF